MLVEERKEAEYARYKCAQAERHAGEHQGNAVRFAAELEFVWKENKALRGELGKEKGRADQWEERCHMWEARFGHLIENADDYLA
jgi:hypothetical protein